MTAQDSIQTGGATSAAALESALRLLDELDASGDAQVGARLQELRELLEPIATEAAAQGSPTLVPAPTPAPTPAPSADSIESDLLEGDFETVAEVLSSVFDEKAVLIDHVAAESIEPAVHATAEPEQAEAPPAPASPAVPSAVEEPPEPVAPPVPTVTETGAIDPIGQSLEPTEAAAPPPPSTPRPPRLPAIAAVTRRAAVTALTFINFPLRFLPPSIRPFVDWVALSLIFWVPVVWMLVLLF